MSLAEDVNLVLIGRQPKVILFSSLFLLLVFCRIKTSSKKINYRRVRAREIP